MFSKREGILVSKLSAEPHGPGRGAARKAPLNPGRGQKNKLSSVPTAGRKIMGHAPFCKSAEIVTAPLAQTAGAVGLYHVHPCSSSCFPAPQQAFVGEMGQKRRLVAASSYVFEKGRNFSKQVGR